MPMLNKIRLTNLSYNYGHNTISDVTLDLQKTNTLLRMENGGGKSVIVQMLLAPYIHARQRNFPKRPFADYFTSPNPSFVMQEWVKDSDGGYFCVGYLARRRQASDNIEEKLDFYTWIAEYDDPQTVPFSLDALELLKTTPQGRRRFVQFSEIKEALSAFEVSHPGKFELFNMNNNAHQKSYFSRLTQFGVDPGEWRQMREFNTEESGLAKFCTQYSTEEKLIRQVLIPAASRKIDREAKTDDANGHMIRFQNETLTYIDLYKSNRKMFEQLEILTEFSKVLESIHEQALSLKGDHQAAWQAKQKLISLAASIQSAIVSFQRDEIDYAALIETARKEIARTDHEILSVDWHKENDQKEKLQAVLEDRQSVFTSLQSDLDHTVLQERQLECARLDQEVRNYSSRVVEYQEKVNSARLDDEQIRKKQRAYGSALYELYSRQAAECKENCSQAIADLEGQKTEIAQTRAEKKKIEKELRSLLGRISSLETSFNAFRKKEADFSRTYSRSIEHSMVWEEDEELYTALQNQLKAEYDGQIEKTRQAKSHLESLQEQDTQLVETIHQTKMEQSENRNALKQALALCQTLDDSLARKQDFLDRVNLGEEALWDDQRIQSAVRELSDRLFGRISQAANRIAEANAQLKNLETGLLSKLDDPIREVFSDLGIEIITGTQWLRESPMKKEKKERLIDEHPFFPYAIILDQKDARRVIKILQEKELHVSAPLIFCSREALNHQSELPGGDLSFYLRFNKNFIFPEEIKRLKEELQNEISHQTIYQNDVSMQRDQLQNAYARIIEDDLSQKQIEEAKTAHEQAEEKKLSLAIALQKLQETQKSLHSQITKAKEALLENETQRDHLKERQRRWDEIVHELPSALDAYREQSGLLVRQEQKTKESEAAERRLQAMQENLIVLNQNLDTLHRLASETDELVSRFSMFKGSHPAKGDKDELEARYRSIQEKLSSSQLAVYESELTSASEKLHAAEADLKLTAESYQLSSEDWKTVSYSMQNVLDNRKKQEKLRRQIDKLQKEISKLEVNISRREGRIEAIEEQIFTLTSQCAPLSKKECRTSDLSERKKRLDADLASLKNAQKALAEKKQAFRQHALSIENKLGMEISASEYGETIEDLCATDAKTVQNRMSQSIIDLEHCSKALDTNRQTLDTEISRKMEKYRRILPICTDILESIRARIDVYDVLPDEIEKRQQLLQNRIDKTSSDLEILKTKRSQLTEMIMDYIERLHTQIKLIDHDTSIQIQGTPRKMLNLDMKPWEELQSGARLRLDAFLDQIIAQCEARPGEQEKIVSANIQADELYNQLCEIRTIRVRLYKIEADRQISTDWHKAAAMSGAEGFLCAFVIVSAVLNYQRKDMNSIIYGKKAMHTMIFDNPFAYVQSRHIIEALMGLCKSTNTQMIALSNVTNSDVINAFDNIYSLRLISSFDNRNHLATEHTKRASLPDLKSVEPVQIRIEQGTFDFGDE